MSLLVDMDDRESSLGDILAGMDGSFQGQMDSFLGLQEENRETFPLSSHSHRLQIAHLEARIRDYTEQLEAKDREIALMRALQSPMQREGGSTGVLDSNLVLLEEENKQLRGISQLRVEVDKLRRELIQAQKVKSNCESKYNEAALKLISLQKDGESPDREASKMKEILQKVELFKVANSDLHAQVSTLSAALQTSQSERSHLKGAVIPDLQRTLSSLESEIQSLEKGLAVLKGSPAKSKIKESHITLMELEQPDPMLSELHTDRFDTRTCYSPVSDTPRLSPRHQSPELYRKSVPGSQLGDAKAPRLRLVSNPKKVITSRPAGLARPQAKKQRGGKDNFADAFPDESELV